METSEHSTNSTLVSTFIDPIRECIDSFRPFRELCEHVIDPDALAMTPPEFLVRPTYDATLESIAQRKTQLFAEITAVFDSVDADPRGES